MVPNLFVFIFSRNFLFRKVRGRWFQIWYSFQIWAPKYPNQIYLLSSLKHFIFSPNFASRQIQRRRFLDMTIVFSSSTPKIPILGIFGRKFRRFCFLFRKILPLNKFWVLVSNMTLPFSNTTPKIHKMEILVTNLWIFILHQALQLEKFEGVDFKYELCPKIPK